MHAKLKSPKTQQTEPLANSFSPFQALTPGCAGRRGTFPLRRGFVGIQTEEIPLKKLVLLAATALALVNVTAVNAAPPEKPGHVDPMPGTKSDAMSATKDKMGHAVGIVSAEMTTTTKGFVAAAATTDMYEVEAAKIASMRSHDEMVKKFAKNMISAHTKTTDELKEIVADQKLDLTPPASLDTRRQSMIDDLRGVKAADFDERYIAQQVDAHEEALILMRGYHNSGDNASLKKFAGNVENAVKMHLSMVKRLDKKDEAMEEKNEKH
jgi:putative membrane protein